ncbi:MAG TPA: hypothetical protein PLD47_13935 [Aggregatilineales bacterium]|nr:MAG: hypothetical protein HKUEN02_01010 [Anaerolineaceae bacterium]HRE48822.1 hypothetical protein [Aggregatilineales bacterium]
MSKPITIEDMQKAYYQFMAAKYPNRKRIPAPRLERFTPTEHPRRLVGAIPQVFVLLTQEYLTTLPKDRDTAELRGMAQARFEDGDDFPTGWYIDLGAMTWGFCGATLEAARQLFETARQTILSNRGGN